MLASLLGSFLFSTVRDGTHGLMHTRQYLTIELYPERVSHASLLWDHGVTGQREHLAKQLTQAVFRIKRQEGGRGEGRRSREGGAGGERMRRKGEAEGKKGSEREKRPEGRGEERRWDREGEDGDKDK